MEKEMGKRHVGLGEARLMLAVKPGELKRLRSPVNPKKNTIVGYTERRNPSVQETHEGIMPKCQTKTQLISG